MIILSNELIKTILARRSIRKYSENRIKEDDILIMLKAAMAATSGVNYKPWHFIVITNRQILNNLAEVHSAGKMLFEAPLYIAICGDTTISEKYWVQDCSAATENILLAATAIGLGAVWLGVYPVKERLIPIKKILRLPEHIQPLNLVSIGYPDEVKNPRTQYDKSRIHCQCW